MRLMPGQPDQRYAVICINASSRNGADADASAFARLLNDAGIETEIVPLDDGSTVDGLFQGDARKPDLVVLAGGDGTVHRAVPALLKASCPFAVLPLGTANDLARGLGIPNDAAGAAAVIVNGATCAIDIATANEHPFLNVAGIGLGPAMTRNMQAEEKVRWGVLSYLLALLRTVRGHKSFKAMITCDGTRLRVRALQINVANGKYYGGGMTATDSTRQDDGKLDLVVVKAVGFWRLLRMGPSLRWGKVALEPEVLVRRAEKIHVATHKTMTVTSDGEPTTDTPVSFTVLAQRARVYVAPEADAVVPDVEWGSS